MFKMLMDDINRDLEELHSDEGRMSRATELAEATGMSFNAAKYPLYFTGDLEAKIVLVHLNPKQKNEPAGATLAEPTFSDDRSYVEHFTTFGERAYGPDSDRKQPPRFDEKQVRFLRPFDVIDFVDPDHADDARFLNLQRVVDDKLQLELVPYGSDTFDTGKVLKHPELLKPHFDRLIDTISACDRDYVIFCGAAFDALLDPTWMEETESFNLRTKTGTMRKKTRCTPLTIPTAGSGIKAMLAQSYSLQGIPMGAYGEAVAQNYRRWKDQP